MPMKPHKNEDQASFMGRCVPDMIGTGPNKRPQEQAVAICLGIWRQERGGPAPKKQTAFLDARAAAELAKALK